MNLCDDGHGEVCYDGRDCPACEMKERVEELDGIIDGLRGQISDLESQIEELETSEE